MLFITINNSHERGELLQALAGAIKRESSAEQTLPLRRILTRKLDNM
jgi:hypothetical protein